MLQSRWWLLLALFALTACGMGIESTRRSATPVTAELTLENGLKVVVREDHRAPVVVSQIWYKVGASDEPDGLTGISHVLEHMMFKGTARHPSGEFSRIIAENGGRENAFTGPDYTAYFQQLEKSRLAVAFELEADRMQNLVLDEAEAKKEIKVVMEERRLRTDDSPQGLAHEHFMATAYTVHAYKNPIIGWMRDLERLTVADLRAWYKQWYVPGNATLVVVGDVKPDDVFRLARQHFGPIQAAKAKRPRARTEPLQIATRRSSIQAPAEVPMLLMGFHVPSFTRADSPDPYALMVLSGILDGGHSARFERALIRGKEIAAGISTGYSPTARYPGLFTFSATPAKQHTVEALENALLAEIKRVRNEKVSAGELARVKAQVAAGSVFARDSVFYQAMQMGMLETVGLDWRILDQYEQRIRAVTAGQVQEAARRYLSESNMTVTVLEPQPGKLKPRSPAPVGDRHGH